MGTFRTYLEETYRVDPSGAAHFLSDACVLVRIRRRYWRGLRRMKDAKVLSDDAEVGRDATTRPSWKLCPPAVRAEFEALGAEVETLLARYALNRGSGRGAAPDDDEAGPALVGNGTYAVDAAAWPALREKLAVAQAKWGDHAARWFSDDGYEQFHAELAAHLGEAEYARVKALVPPAGHLLGRTGLDVRRAPVRFVSDDRPDTREELLGLFDMAVRVPREDAAEAWETLAAQLVTPEGTPAVPKGRPGPDGVERVGTRKVTGRSVAAAGREATTLDARAARYLDDRLRGAVQALIRELPEDAAAASATARNLNSRDDEAVRVGKMLLAAAALARDESGMCEGFAAARTR